MHAYYVFLDRFLLVLEALGPVVLFTDLLGFGELFIHILE
jgi:hypothetical protein